MTVGMGLEVLVIKNTKIHYGLNNCYLNDLF